MKKMFNLYMESAVDTKNSIIITVIIIVQKTFFLKTIIQASQI